MPNITNDSSQYTDNKEHDPTMLSKRIVKVPFDGQMIVFDEASSVQYIGFGASGLATSDSGWLVRKIDSSADPMTIKHAIGILDNKASLTYT